MVKKFRVPIGSVVIHCPGCLHTDGWNLHEAVTDTGTHQERYYASCLKCGHVFPLRGKENVR